MRKNLITLTFLLALGSSAVAQVPLPPPVPGVVKVGLLGCTLSPTIGLIIGSFQTMQCQFTPDGPYPPEMYSGTFGTVGLDIGVTFAQGLAWAVYAPTAGPPQGGLAGAYGGPSAEIAVGLGAGANLMFGGSARSYALQPVSVSGEVAVNVSLGLSGMQLQWVR